MQLKITSPATSANLGAGFDSLGVALSLRNEFRLASASFERVRISGLGAASPALKGNNLFVNILREWLKRLGHSTLRADIEIHNAIALSRGMGSSSSVIIAALAGAFELAGRPVDEQISRAELVELSREYEPHTDNTAPCALGGFTVSLPAFAGGAAGGAAGAAGGAAAEAGATLAGTPANSSAGAANPGVSGEAANSSACAAKPGASGEAPQSPAPLRFEPPKGAKAIIAVPRARISTAASREALAASVKLADASANLARAAAIAAAFASGDLRLLRSAWGDALHQRARMLSLAGIYRSVFAALLGAKAATAEQIAAAFGEEFLPTAEQITAVKTAIGTGAANAAPTADSAEQSAYFCALSGSGSSFLTIAPEHAAPQIAAALATVSALEAVHVLDFDARGLVIERRALG